MMTPAISRRADELVAQGAAFVIATVVRVQRPASVEPGSVALVLGDGTIEGFVGGACTETSVRAYSLAVLESGEPMLLRILPDTGHGDDHADHTGAEVAREDGAVTVRNPCLSGGAIEMFLEPALPALRVVVVGDTPIAHAVLRIGAELGLDLVAARAGEREPGTGDLALVVASHGRDELHLLRRGLEADLPYIGLVASRRRGAGVLEELRADGVPAELLERIDVPAGLDIGARTPAEIALSILAEIVAVRRDRRTEAPKAARSDVPASAPAGTLHVDPICGMTVAASANTPSVEFAGETVYFCCAGCKAKFEAQHEHVA